MRSSTAYSLLQSDGDKVQGLVDQEADVELETNGQQVRDRTQSLERSNCLPVSAESGVLEHEVRERQSWTGEEPGRKHSRIESRNQR